MSKYTIAILESGEIQAKRYLVRKDLMAEWYTDWVTDKGYVTRIKFDNLEDAMEFYLKFSDYIDYSLTKN